MAGKEDRIVGRYNTHSPSVQRILKEVKEIHMTPSSLFSAAPLEVFMLLILFRYYKNRNLLDSPGLCSVNSLALVNS